MILENKTAHMPNLEYDMRITRDVKGDDLTAMMRLRRESYYPDPRDARYAKGGIHNLRDETWIEESHAKDASSHFVLVTDAEGILVAYSRFSFVEPNCPNYDQRLLSLMPEKKAARVVWLQVIIVGKQFRGKATVVNGRCGRIADLVFDERLRFAREQGCVAAFCDVATLPVRNEVSINFITRHGMKEIGKGEDIVREGMPVAFTRFAALI
ncbi:MAG: hypothetical protein WCD70_15885 [Alphaproteobacteria bacterium]